MMSRMLMIVAGLATAGTADAAVVTQSYTLTASNFVNFFNETSPITSVSAAFTLNYDDAVSGFQGAPASFSSVTNGVANVGPFAATPIFGYFPANGFSPFPRLGVGGALNGGNTLSNGSDDFYFTFDAGATGPTSAMLSFTAAGNRVGFIATDAVVTPVALPAAVPEPATWALLIGGFGMAGMAARRRRRMVARLA